MLSGKFAVSRRTRQRGTYICTSDSASGGPCIFALPPVLRTGEFPGMGPWSWEMYFEHRLSASPPKDKAQHRAGEQAHITDTEVRKGTLIGQQQQMAIRRRLPDRGCRNESSYVVIGRHDPGIGQRHHGITQYADEHQHPHRTWTAAGNRPHSPYENYDPERETQRQRCRAFPREPERDYQRKAKDHLQRFGFSCFCKWAVWGRFRTLIARYLGSHSVVATRNYQARINP